MNPNNCDTCGHKQNPDGGHCYMFRDEPSDVCMQHTGRAIYERMTSYMPLELIQRLAKGSKETAICLSCGSTRERDQQCCGH